MWIWMKGISRLLCICWVVWKCWISVTINYQVINETRFQMQLCCVDCSLSHVANAGNIPVELSQLGSLSELHLNNNCLIGKPLSDAVIFTINSVFLHTAQGECRWSWRCCRICHDSSSVEIVSQATTTQSFDYNIIFFWTGKTGNFSGRGAVQRYMDSMPLTEINMSLRRNFLMFLIGCHLHGVPVLASGPRSVVKCMSIPYIDRALLEYIFSSRGWAHSLKEYLFWRRVVHIIAVKVD